MNKAKTIEAATLSMQGAKDETICEQLGISPADLMAMRKSKLFARTEDTLAQELINKSAATLTAMAHQGLARLKEAMSAPLENRTGEVGSGFERIIVDPSYMRELRLAVELVYNLSLDAIEENEEDEEAR